MNLYPDLVEYRQSEKEMNDSIEIISEDIPLEDDHEIKQKSMDSKILIFNESKEKKEDDSIFTKLHSLKDPFMDNRIAEIKDLKTTTEWFL